MIGLLEMAHIELSKTMYSERALRQAIEAYRSIVRIVLDANATYWILSFSDCIYAPNETFYEFENYLVSLEAGIHHGL